MLAEKESKKLHASYFLFATCTNFAMYSKRPTLSPDLQCGIKFLVVILGYIITLSKTHSNIVIEFWDSYYCSMEWHSKPD